MIKPDLYNLEIFTRYTKMTGDECIKSEQRQLEKGKNHSDTEAYREGIRKGLDFLCQILDEATQTLHELQLKNCGNDQDFIQ